VIQANYTEVVDTLKANNGAEAKAIKAMLGGDKALMDRFLATCFSLLAKQSDLLYKATPISIVQAIKDAAADGLEPMTDDGAIIERGGIATWNPMWRGYLKRIRNSGKVVDVDCQIVYENDVFEMSMGTDPGIRHVPILPEFKTVEDGSREEIQGRGDYRGCYAWALMPSGKYIIEWMTTADINAVRDHFSRAKADGTPWKTSWGEMARKTVIRRLAKRLPASAVDHLLAVDQRNDVMAAEQAKQLARIDDDLSEVRNLALQAVSGGPSTPPEEPSDVPEAAPAEDVAAGPTEPFAGDHAVYVAPDGTVSDPVADERAPDPGVDPNVAAAIALSAEQEQLARIRGKK
jgi:recombination protein RecT